jgi:hypothetical protein
MTDINSIEVPQVNSLPPVPLRSEAGNTFALKSEAFVAALPAFRIGMIALESVTRQLALIAQAEALAAASYAAAAADSTGSALASKNAAATSASNAATSASSAASSASSATTSKNAAATSASAAASSASNANSSKLAAEAASLAASTNLIDRLILRYDNTKSFSKSKYMSATYNDGGSIQSPWFLVAPMVEGEVVYTGDEFSLGVIDFYTAYAYVAGYYDVPPYSIDKSWSRMQFCFANYESSSAELDARIAAGALIINTYGGWSSDATKGYIPVLKTAHHPYSALFVRFINTGYNSTALPQSIAKYGGDCSFKLNQITIFNKIKYKDVVK